MNDQARRERDERLLRQDNERDTARTNRSKWPIPMHYEEGRLKVDEDQEHAAR